MKPVSMDSLRRRGPEKQNRAAEQREWKRKLHRMVDKLRDSFCRQHALDLIFTEEGDTHLSAEMYINMDNTVEDPEWVPSPIFQVFPYFLACDDKSWKLICRMLLLPKFPKKLSSSAYLTCSSLQELYAKLNKMASAATEIFVGRERFATLLMMRLTETVMLWLSDDQSFWEEIEEGPRALGPLGLQQVISFFNFVRVCFLHFSLQNLPGLRMTANIPFYFTFLFSSTWICNLSSFLGKGVSYLGMCIRSYWRSLIER
jgi:hypothetical protein